MRYTFYIILFYVLPYAKGPPGEFNAKSPLEVAKRGDVYYPYPKQSSYQFPLSFTIRRIKYCPYIAKITPSSPPKSCLQASELNTCPNEVKWITVHRPGSCGRGALQGNIYNFQYNFCGPAPRQLTAERMSYAMIFSICYNTSTNQPMHIEYKIASYTYNTMRILQPNTYSNKLQKILALQTTSTNMTNIAAAYDNYMNQRKDTNMDYPDVVIPQMLLPETDFDPEYARGANLTYAVVRPQYRRLSNCWGSLNKIIWQQYYRPETNATILAGTAQNLSVRGTERIIYVHPTDWITIPLIWWKAVFTNNMLAIVLFHNVPRNYDKPQKYMCSTQQKTATIRQFCTHIKSELQYCDGIYLECCELTLNIAKEINLRHERIPEH